MTQGNVLITGANRGLGLEFARQYTAAGWRVIGTARDPAQADELRAIADVRTLDVADDASIATFLAGIGDAPLDRLIANAGIGSGTQKTAGEVTREEWRSAISINSFAPFRIATALKANLARGSDPKLVGISSLAASIATYPISGHYAYRASKAALNSLWRSLAVEWKPLGIVCLVMRPGRVRTRMTGFTGDLDAVTSVTGMRQVIDRAGIPESGRFWGYDGAEVPW